LFQTEAFKDFSKDDALLMMSEAKKMAVNVILPTLAAGDKEGCTLKDGKVSVPKSYHEALRNTSKLAGSAPRRRPMWAGRGCLSHWRLPTWNTAMPPISPY